MLRKFFSLFITISIVSVVAGVGWVAYSKFNVSEAAQFNESISMVYHQTGSMGESLDDTGDFVSTEISNISSISTLLDEWDPRYEQAQTAYRKFDAAIVAAEDRAEAYFLAQRTLTEQYHDQELRAEARADDDADYALYHQWKDRAHYVREDALEIVNRLQDVDTGLRKLKLSSEFSFDASGFDAVPAEIQVLGEDLTQFQIASENIRDITKSPFDPGQ